MISINKIAKEAGVSKSTVSKVVNDKPGVTQETKDKVLEIIKKYDYQPNFFASHTSKKVSCNLIGIIDEAFFGMEYIPYFPNLTAYIAQEAAKSKKNVIIYLTEDKNEVLNILKNTTSPIDGAIFVNPTTNDQIINQLQKGDIPVVTIGTPDFELNENLSYCDSDTTKATEAITNYILDEGFKKPVLVDRDYPLTVIQNRFKSFKKVCNERNVQPHISYIEILESHFKDKALKLIEEGYDSIIVPSTSFVKDALDAIKEKGLIVGKDIEVCALGYGNEDRETLKQVTYVEDDWNKLGVAAVELLNQMLNGKKIQDLIIVPSKINYKK